MCDFCGFHSKLNAPGFQTQRFSVLVILIFGAILGLLGLCWIHNLRDEDFGTRILILGLWTRILGIVSGLPVTSEQGILRNPQVVRIVSCAGRDYRAEAQSWLGIIAVSVSGRRGCIRLRIGRILPQD